MNHRSNVFSRVWNRLSADRHHLRGRLIELLEAQHVGRFLVEIHAAHGVEPVALLVDQELLHVALI